MLVTIYSKLIKDEFYIETENDRVHPGIQPLFYLKEIEVITEAVGELELKERAKYFSVIIETKKRFGGSILDKNGRVIVPKEYLITKRKTRRPASIPRGGAMAALKKKIAKDKAEKEKNE